jgi:two-component system sensor histidine kinase TctE
VEIAQSVIQDSLPHALERHIDLGYEGVGADSRGVRILGNATLLKELVRNLVDNAMSYTPSNAQTPGVITVRVLSDTAAKVVALQVEDSGPGIPATEREQIFQPFYRVLGTEVDGSGLGLAIVMEVAQLHGATVNVQDASPGKPNPGASFTVLFQNTLT